MPGNVLMIRGRDYCCFYELPSLRQRMRSRCVRIGGQISARINSPLANGGGVCVKTIINRAVAKSVSSPANCDGYVSHVFCTRLSQQRKIDCANALSNVGHYYDAK